MATNRKIEIISGYLWVREEPLKSANQVRTVSKGEQYTVTSTSSNAYGEVWNKITYGWICVRDSNYVYAKDITDSSSSSNSDSTTELNNEDYDKIKEETDSFYDLDKIDFSSYVSDFGTGETNVKNFLTNVRGIHGMPYQFMSEVDPKIEGSGYGREYTENVVSRMPLLLLTPGKPVFMKGYTKDEQVDVLQGYMKEKLNNVIDDLLDTKNGRYYSFAFNYQEYYQYLNAMCQSAACFLGIGDEVFDGTPLRSYKWENYNNPALRNFISSNESLAFYIDSETQISESFSNSVGESQLMSMANSASDLSREVQFLLGGMSGLDMTKFSQNIQSTQKEFNDFSNKYLNGGVGTNLLNSLIDTGVTTVVAGGKMIFPEIWNESSYSRDYDINIKLRSPDYDTLSLFVNLYVPMFMLVCLVAPQSLGANGYKSPFLVRGYYKGFFNCNMGLITNMSITRGDKSEWTRRGLPTQIDISFTIKDLYALITLTKSVNPIAFCQNTCLIDWISNMCAININKPDILRTVDLYATMISNNVKNLITLDGFSGVKQSLTNLLSKYFGR